MKHDVDEIHAQFFSCLTGQRMEAMDRVVLLQGGCVPHVLIVNKSAYMLFSTFFDNDGMYGQYIHITYTAINTRTGKIKYR